jgi:hypothetical protein
MTRIHPLAIAAVVSVAAFSVSFVPRAQAQQDLTSGGQQATAPLQPTQRPTAAADSEAPTTARERPAGGVSMVESHAVGVRPRSAATEGRSVNDAASGLLPRRSNKNVTYMIVGGAGLLTGLVIGDDVGTLIAVGGTVLGLYGLYQYLQHS